MTSEKQDYLGGLHSVEWKAFRNSMLKRAKYRCEECGARPGQKNPDTGRNVWLHVAHLDHDKTHADPERCRVLCVTCHAQYDLEHRRQAILATNRANKPHLNDNPYRAAIDILSDKGMTQAVVADRIGISYGHLRNVLAGTQSLARAPQMLLDLLVKEASDQK